MVQVSRRAALGAGVGLVGGLILGAGALPAEAAAAPKAPASSPVLARSNYTASIGKPFTAERAGRTSTITLARIHDVDGAAADQSESSFNLIFDGRPRLPEGIYTISRRGVPTGQLFLGHVGDGTAMQALVNRSR